MRVPNVALQAYLSYKATFHWLNWPAYVSNVVLRPMLAVTMFGLTARFARDEQAAINVVIGMLAFSLLTILMGGLLQSFFNERSFGTLPFIFSSTGGRLQHFLARGFLHYPNAILNVASGLLFAIVVLGMDFGAARWPAVALSLFTLALSCTLFGLFLANLCIVFRNWNFFMAIAQTGFLALAGIVIPRTALPIGLEELSAVLPISHGLDGLRSAFAGEAFSTVAGDLLLELAIGISYGVIGFLAFRTLEAYARRSGAYDEI